MEIAPLPNTPLPSAPRTTPAANADRRIDEAAKEFEAVLIAQMLAPIFASVDAPKIAGGGKSEAFFQNLLQESYAKGMAERGGFGLADHVKSSLISLQSAASDETRARSQS